MAKIRLTKNELKSQRDSLKRFERYLPTLQLKKQQLQMEVRKAHEEMRTITRNEAIYNEKIAEWIEVFAESAKDDLFKLIEVDSWKVGEKNIAGTDVPVFHSVSFKPISYDLYSTPMWYDDVLDVIKKILEFRLMHRLIQEQVELLDHELRIITQRVNLFEKVKIPEAKGNVRVIQIYLGDQQTSAVGRAKIAKEKCKAKAKAASF